MIKFGLTVGIGAGIPRDGHDIRLGDVVVGCPGGTSEGVIQYYLGKAKINSTWERRDALNQPPEVLLKALGHLQAEHELGNFKMTRFIQAAADRNPRWAKSSIYSKRSSDRLFKSGYHHVGNIQDCSQSILDAEIVRSERDEQGPILHYGIIASGNSIVKYPEVRERIAMLDEHCICIEMEAAGLLNKLPCMVIRGISGMLFCFVVYFQ